MLTFFLKLSWKNVWRNKRRTLLTCIAISLGIMALVCIRNYYDGFHEEVVRNVIRFHSGHLVINAKDYPENASPSLFLSSPTPFIEWLQKRGEVEAHSKRILIQGLVSSAEGSSNVLFMGVEPESEKRVTKFASTLKEGTFLGEAGSKSIVIGRKLAELLRVSLGSKIVALTQGIDGSIGNELFRIAGIFETQSDADKNLVFVPLEDAKGLTALPEGAIHQISILLKNDHSSEVVKNEFKSAFPIAELTAKSPVMFEWREVQKHIQGMIELDKAFNRLLMFIILGVASLGIANSILMSILERTKEFGVMLAIGTHRIEMIGLVLMETLLLCIIGVVIGNVLAFGVTSYFQWNGFDLRWLTSQSLVIDGTMMKTITYPKMQWENSLIVTSTIMGLTFIVSLIPTRHLSKLTPVKALRSH